jgi:hypothetical protein
MPTEERQLAAIMFTDLVCYNATAQRGEAPSGFQPLQKQQRVTFLGSLG